MKNTPCIGRLPAEEILAAADLDFCDFTNKTVLDIGCWVWWILQLLADNTDASRLVWIDPIFENPKTLRKWIQETQEYVDSLLQTPNLPVWSYKKIEACRDTVDRFSIENTKVEYYARIARLKRFKFDYVFISFVFVHLQQELQNKLLHQAFSAWAKRWKIIVIDSVSIIPKIYGILPKGEIVNYRATISCLKFVEIL